jgi:cytochrome P450
VEGQIVDLLTPEQLQQYHQLRNEMAHKWLQQMQKQVEKVNHPT